MAFGAVTYTYDVYKSVDNTKLATASTHVTYNKAVAVPKDIAGDPTGNGSVATYTLAVQSGVAEGNYVEVADSEKSDLYIVKTGTTQKIFLKAVVDGSYMYTATKVTNIGVKCGQLNVNNAATVSYYTYTDKDGATYIYAGTDKANCDLNVVVDGQLVMLDNTTNFGLVKHTWVNPVEKDGKVVSMSCKYCSVVGTVVEKKASIPTGAGWDNCPYGGYLYFNAPAAGSTTVESAKTFDAGIALYAGMALASVAGSAVVIGKKKEF